MGNCPHRSPAQFLSQQLLRTVAHTGTHTPPAIGTFSISFAFTSCTCTPSTLLPHGFLHWFSTFFLHKPPLFSLRGCFPPFRLLFTHPSNRTVRVWFVIHLLSFSFPSLALLFFSFLSFPSKAPLLFLHSFSTSSFLLHVVAAGTPLPAALHFALLLLTLHYFYFSDFRLAFRRLGLTCAPLLRFAQTVPPWWRKRSETLSRSLFL